MVRPIQLIAHNVQNCCQVIKPSPPPCAVPWFAHNSEFAASWVIRIKQGDEVLDGQRGHWRHRFTCVGVVPVERTYRGLGACERRLTDEAHQLVRWAGLEGFDLLEKGEIVFFGESGHELTPRMWVVGLERFNHFVKLNTVFFGEGGHLVVLEDSCFQGKAPKGLRLLSGWDAAQLGASQFLHGAAVVAIRAGGNDNRGIDVATPDMHTLHVHRAEAKIIESS